MLKFDNVSFSYSRRRGPVIKDFSLDIEPGGVYGLLGKNGVGKSTLLYLMAGALTPSRGEVLYRGVNTRLRLPSTLSDMFIVPEEFVLPSISLRDFVRVNSVFYPDFSSEDMGRHLDVFGMDECVNLGELSMGQKKKALMSFALACNTPLVIMDEPTNGLDIPGKDAFRRFIAGGMRDDRTFVISTHQVRDMDRMLDHIIIMDDARILLNAGISEIGRRLKFTLTDSPAVISSALYASPSIGGTAVVLPNKDGRETEIDVEMLFNLATERPYIVQSVFSDYKTQIDNGCQ